MFFVILPNPLFIPDVPLSETERQAIVLISKEEDMNLTIKSKMDIQEVDTPNRDSMCCMCWVRLSTEALQGLQSYWNHKCVQEEGYQNGHGRVTANGVPCYTGNTLHSRESHCSTNLVTMSDCRESALLCTKQGRLPLTVGILRLLKLRLFKGVVVNSNTLDFYDWKLDKCECDPVVSGGLPQKSEFTVPVISKTRAFKVQHLLVARSCSCPTQTSTGNF